MIPLGVSVVWWGPLLAVSLMLLAVAAILTVGIARGRITMELGWGRATLPLRDRRLSIQASPEVVMGLLWESARGKVPGISKRERTTVLEEGGDLVVNESLTESRFGLVRSREAVRFHPVGRVTYRHLAGPLPGTEEVFELRPLEGGTELSYHGRIPVDFWALGRVVARWLILPEYERLLDVHIAALAKTSEAWARLSSRWCPQRRAERRT